MKEGIEAEKGGKNTAIQEEDNGDEEEGSDGDGDLIFKVKLTSPEPAGVKISKKNICLVTISKSEKVHKEAELQRRMVEYFLAQK